MHDPGGRMVEVARLLAAARTVAVLTGAGVSAESGVPTFRGPGGLWRSFRPEQLATPEAFARDPVLVWEWYRWRRSRVAAARPNPGHVALARLEGRVPALTVVTQNVDGLHARAGSRRRTPMTRGRMGRHATGRGRRDHAQCAGRGWAVDHHARNVRVGRPGCGPPRRRATGGGAPAPPRAARRPPSPARWSRAAPWAEAA